MPGYEGLTPMSLDMPTCIVHGWQDDVVPVENSIRFAQSCRAELHVLDGGHRMNENIDEINYYLGRFIEKIGS
jgi:pimeloyl-ACP methyl ester carboxylesterase